VNEVGAEPRAAPSSTGCDGGGGGLGFGGRARAIAVEEPEEAAVVAAAPAVVVPVAAVVLEESRWGLLVEVAVLVAPAPHPSRAVAATAPSAIRLETFTMFDELARRRSASRFHVSIAPRAMFAARGLKQGSPA
jgi:hypothetical protein